MDTVNQSNFIHESKNSSTENRQAPSQEPIRSLAKDSFAGRTSAELTAFLVKVKNPKWLSGSIGKLERVAVGIINPLPLRQKNQIIRIFHHFNDHSDREGGLAALILGRLQKDTKQDIALRLVKIGSDFWRTASKTQVVDLENRVLIPLAEGYGTTAKACSHKMKEIFSFFYPIYSDGCPSPETFPEQEFSGNTAAGEWLKSLYQKEEFSPLFLRFLFTRSQTNNVGCMQEILKPFSATRKAANQNRWVNMDTKQATYTLRFDKRSGYLEAHIEMPVLLNAAEPGSAITNTLARTNLSYSIIYNKFLKPIKVLFKTDDNIVMN